MKYTEYSFEHFDNINGVNKVQKWIDGPSVDYLDYTINKNKNYRLSYYDIKSLVFNFIRNNDKERVIDVIKNSVDVNSNYLWDTLLDYNIHSNHKDSIIEFSKFLLENNLYPSLSQTISFISLNCEEFNSMLKLKERNFNFGEPSFDEYSKLISSLNKEQLDLLESIGFKRHQEWDITIKTLKENNMVSIINKPQYKYSLFNEQLFRPLMNPLYLI